MKTVFFIAVEDQIYAKDVDKDSTIPNNLKNV